MGDAAEIQIAEIETVPQLPVKRAEKPPIKSGGPLDAIIPQDLDEAWRLTDAIIKAGMVPNSYEGKDGNATRAALMIGILKGLEVGLPPITALSTIMIVNNRPSIWGDGAVALVQAKGHVEKVEQTFTGTDGQDDWTATYRIWRKGQSEPYVGTFSVKDAKRAHLWANVKKPIWSMYPQRMLMARARAYALRDGFADCLAGLAIAEEMQDLPAPPEKVETAFLDDAPEPQAVIEHKPGPAAEPANDTAPATDWPAFLESINEELADADAEEIALIFERNAAALDRMKSEVPELHSKVGK